MKQSYYVYYAILTPERLEELKLVLQAENPSYKDEVMDLIEFFEHHRRIDLKYGIKK